MSTSFLYIYGILYFYWKLSKIIIVSIGCGTADEHTEHLKPCPYLRYGAQASYRNCAALAAMQFFSSRSQNGMLFSTRFTELIEALPVSLIRRAGLIQKLRSFSCSAIFQFVKNNSRQGMNFPSENSTIISASAHSAQTCF